MTDIRTGFKAMHILFLLQTGFSIWMLVDALSRGCRPFWYFVILMPFGEWVYFFAVKIHDPQFFKWKRKFTHRPASLKELKYKASRSPSMQNRLLLAQALHDHKKYDEAASLFREILDSDSDEKRALYGLARCLVETSQTKAAIEALEELVERDFGYEDFAPGVSLAQTYWESGDRLKATELMERVVRKSNRLRHMVQLAHYMQEQQQADEAKRMLEEALEDHENAPKYIRRAEKAWAKKARTTLRSL